MSVNRLLQLEPRPLSTALAQEFATLKPGKDAARLALLNRIFCGSNAATQMLCRIELTSIKAAKRGELLARVS